MQHNDKLKRSTKLIYGVGDVVNSAIGFFLLAFYTDAAYIAAGLASTAPLPPRPPPSSRSWSSAPTHFRAAPPWAGGTCRYLLI